MKRLLTFCFTLLMLASAPLKAQTDDAPIVSAELTVICWDAELQLNCAGYRGDELMIAPMKMRSTRYAYRGPAKFVFSGFEVTDQEGVRPFSPKAEVELVLGRPQQLIILIPAEAGSSLPYRALVVDDSFERFPPQSLRLINFTSQNFAGQLGSANFQLASRADEVVVPESLKGPKYLAPFRLMRRVDEGENWRPVKSTIFPLPKNMRILVLLLQDPRKPFDVKFVMLRDESPAPPVAEEEEEEA